MATKKPHRPARTTNGEPVAEPAANQSGSPKIAHELKSAEEPIVDRDRQEPPPARMTKVELERRVHALEGQVARLRAELEEIRGPQVPWWEKISGSHADDPEAFKEAMRLGREWRESFRPKEKSSKKKSLKKKSQKIKSSDGRS
jgi:hypothetical protein